MAVGQFFRQDGKLQFDANIAPYIYKDKGTAQTFNIPGRYPQWRASSPSGFFVPMNYDADEVIAIVMPDGYAYSKYATLANYGNTYDLGGWQHIYHTTAPANTTITYYRFQSSINVGSGYGGPGLRLWNTNGQLTFDISMRPIIVGGTLSGNGASISLPSARSYASIVQSFAGYSRTEYDGTYEEETNEKGQVISRYWTGSSRARFYGIKTNNAQSASVVEVPFYDSSIKYPVQSPYTSSPPPNTTEYDLPLQNALMVDVTGL